MAYLCFFFFEQAEKAGKNGSALGPGFYMAMSDEVAAEYGTRGDFVHGFPKGNFMACICFTPKSPTKYSFMNKQIGFDNTP